MCLEPLEVTDFPWLPVALAYAMVAATTITCTIVAVAAPIASMKACWSKAGGRGLLLRPSAQRPLPQLAIYICQIAIEYYMVSKNGTQVLTSRFLSSSN